MVGLESSVKGTAFYIDKNGEYQEIGTIESNSVEVEENDKFNDMEDIYNETGFTAELEVKLKKYSKKRFKKLLMAQGIQRNDAEIFASIASNRRAGISRNIFGEFIVQGRVSQWKNRRKKVEK